MQNARLRVSYSASDGVSLVGLTDLHAGHEYLAAPCPAFRFRVHGAGPVVTGDSVGDVTVENRGRDDAEQFTAAVRCRTAPVRFDLAAQLAPDGRAACVTVSAQNLSDAPLVVELLAPVLAGVAVRGAAFGMVPIELGTVAPLDDGVPLSNIGLFERDGFAIAANAFSVATVYGTDGGGVFLSGDAGPLQAFSADRDELSCRCTLELDPHGMDATPPVRLGVHDGDWRAAVDEHLVARPVQTGVEVPAWLRHAGAIFNPLAEGGGGIYQVEPTVSLAERIDSFEQLPELLAEARAFGTSILHLFDFWEGAAGAPHPPYWNKGDYTPRSDLGGAAAFAAGIEAVHAAGGRVILYLEPFIVYEHSGLGRRLGTQWGMRDARTGRLVRPYEHNYSMVSWFRPWQDLLVHTAERFVGDYGADGIFLDSWGWQWNYPCTNAASEHAGTAADWNRGVLETVDRVRSAITAIRPDAVVLCESFTADLAEHAHGGLDASFAWSAAINRDRLPDAPVRYAYPHVTVFSAGRDLAELNQVFATGAGLALGRRWLDDAPYLHRLVALRRRCADALVHGRPVYQPATASPAVFAYCHRGDHSEVITVVNAGQATYKGPLGLERAADGDRYTELLSGRRFAVANGGALVVSVPPGALLVLERD